MYYAHFGLSQPPFRITPNTDFFYGGGNRGPILDALIYAIVQGEGIVKVTGEVGSGKTMLCSMLQAKLPPNVESVYIANPSVSPEEILHAIALELHLKPLRDATHLELMQLLTNHLLARHAAGKQVVMFVEESQSMPIATLEEIRLLSNLETADSKLLQIVLFGQPELDDNLRQPQIRQLRERITHSFRLSPLKTTEIGEYLNFRLRAAGYRGPDVFSRQVVNAIARSSAGLTRRINLIADKALLVAFSENTHSIKSKHVKAAVRDSEFSSYEPLQPRIKVGLAMMLFVVGAGLGIALYSLFEAYQRRAATHDTATAVAPDAAAQSQPIGKSTAPVSHGATASNGSVPAQPEKRVAVKETLDTPSASLPKADPPLVVTAVSPRAAAIAHAVPSPQVSANGNGPTPQASAAPGEILATPIVGANQQAARGDADPVALRLAATENWLKRGNPNAYSIQLLGTDKPEQLNNHLNVISKYVEINEIFVYRTLAKEKPSLTVLYGSFQDRDAAREALARLPAPLKAYKPVLRTMQGVRAEIAQHQSS
jgi:type II secretory pathway predicted ATPase ExeA/septal ring-binding cell division protein DamX